MTDRETQSCLDTGSFRPAAATEGRIKVKVRATLGFTFPVLANERAGRVSAVVVSEW